MINNKRAQNSTIGVTIAIVLGIFLIVFLIWGFSTNWSMFKSTSGSVGGTTIDIVKRACVSQCDNGFYTEFCSVQKDVVDSNGKSVKAACWQEPLNVKCSEFNDCKNPPVVAPEGNTAPNT